MFHNEDNTTMGMPLTTDELALVSGGMIKLDRPPRIDPSSEGTTWVPYGTVKVFLAGVQIN